MSARLNSNINVGRKRAHPALVGAALLLAAGALGGGTAFGYGRTEIPTEIAMTEARIPVLASDDPLKVVGPIAGFNPAAIVSIQESGTCDAPVRSVGFVAEGGTIVAPIEETKQAVSPQITTPEIATSGIVLGRSNPNDITVLRPSDRVTSRLRLGTSTRIRVGGQVSVVLADSDGWTLTPAVVTEFSTRDGSVHSFSVGTDFAEDGTAPTRTFDRGTLVLDRNGDVVGFAGNSGAFVTATRVAATVSELQAAPVFPLPDCS